MEFTFRLAQPVDAAVLAEIHQKSWMFAYGHCVPIDILKKRTDRFPMMW